MSRLTQAAVTRPGPNERTPLIIGHRGACGYAAENTLASAALAHAHAAGLAVHAYTFRSDALPAGFTTPEATLHALLNEAGFDGLFTDQPDIVATFLKSRS